MKKTGKNQRTGRNGGKTSPDSAVPQEAAPSDWSQIKHFTPREFTCRCEGLCDHADRISTEFVAKLDMIREQIGLPITIVSGTRCERYNRKVGGKERSAHVPWTGVSHAADIRCADSTFRFAFLTAALPLFGRIGIGKDFIHVDDDADLPQSVIWIY
ncbi:MAG: D-Ala-D-Ala carboxypeptidase family metallohydrolase [Thermodesulfobacteriota bacterium]